MLYRRLSRRLLLIASLATLLAALPAAAAPWGVRLTYDGDPSTSVSVSWNSDDPTDSHVVYGTSPEALTEDVVAHETHDLPDPLDTGFSARLTGLQPGTTYFYRVGNPGGSFYPSDEPFSFRTLPESSCEAIRLVVIGDNRSDFDGIGPSALWPGILAESLTEMPDFFINTGDMVKNGEDPEEWVNFLLDSEVGFARTPSILTMGNHDEDDVSGDDAIYNRLFALPRNSQTNIEDYYSIDVGPMHLVSLSTQFADPGSQTLTDMLTWLEADLAATDQPWIIVFFHKAIYSKGNHSTGEEDDGAINASFVPLFDTYDVDLVFNGHSHNYERYVPTTGVDLDFGGSGRAFPAGDRDAFRNRTEPVPDGATGTTYVVTGGAGALTATIGGFTCEDSACTYCTGFNINCEQDVFDLDQDGHVVFAGEHNYVVLDVAGPDMAVRAWATETGNSSGDFELDSFEMTSSDFDPSLCSPVAGDTGHPGDVGTSEDADMGSPDGAVGDATQSDDAPDEVVDQASGSDTTSAPDRRRPDVEEPASDGTSEEDGCGCGVAGSSSGRPALWLGAAVALVGVALRRWRVRTGA